MIWIFRAIFGLLAIYFFALAHRLGFPPGQDGQSMFFLLLSIFLALLPFAKSLSFGDIFKFESQVEKLKEEVSSFRTEIRSVLNAQSTAIAGVSNRVSQQTTVNLPPISAAYSADRQIIEHSSAQASKPAKDYVTAYIEENVSDPNLALARLRMDLEAELRRILGKRSRLGGKVDRKYLSMRSLWKEFTNQIPQSGYLVEGLQYVNDVANAAIHGQIVPSEHAEEALSMGIRILEELRSVEPVEQ